MRESDSHLSGFLFVSSACFSGLFAVPYAAALTNFAVLSIIYFTLKIVKCIFIVNVFTICIKLAFGHYFLKTKFNMKI
jgi:hypothetical protein